MLYRNDTRMYPLFKKKLNKQNYKKFRYFKIRVLDDVTDVSYRYEIRVVDKNELKLDFHSWILCHEPVNGHARFYFKKPKVNEGAIHIGKKVYDFELFESPDILERDYAGAEELTFKELFEYIENEDYKNEYRNWYYVFYPLYSSFSTTAMCQFPKKYEDYVIKKKIQYINDVYPKIYPNNKLVPAYVYEFSIKGQNSGAFYIMRTNKVNTEKSNFFKHLPKSTGCKYSDIVARKRSGCMIYNVPASFGLLAYKNHYHEVDYDVIDPERKNVKIL